MRDERWVLPNSSAPETQERLDDREVRTAWDALEGVLSDDGDSQRASMRLWNARNYHGRLLLSLYRHGFFSPKIGATWVLAEARGRTNADIYWELAGKNIFAMKSSFSKFDQVEDRFGVGKLEDKFRASTLRFLKLWKEAGEPQRPTALMATKFAIYERLDPAPNKTDSPLIRFGAEIPEEILAAAKPIIDISDGQLLRAAKSKIGVNSAALLLLNGIEEESSWEGFEEIPDEWAALLFGDDEE